jgi:uncharacterized protein YaaR (DUF327 family)
MSDGELNNVSEPIELQDNDEEPENSDNLIDIDEIFREDDDDDENIDDKIIDEQGRGYEKLKKEENPFKKEFAEELTLLYNLLKETSDFSKELEKKYKSLDSTKVRGISKYTVDLAEAVLNSKNNKLSIMKEIANIKKTISDLKIKSEKDDSKANNGTNSPDYIASAYLKNVLKYGRNKFIQNMGASGSNDDDDEEDDLVSKIEKTRSEIVNTYSEDEYDRFNKIIEDRLENVENPNRSDAGSKYIEYENRGVKIWIKKCVDTGEWEFVALDKNQQQIFDYPIPTRRDTGKMRFSEDGRYATDERGRTYKVIEFYSPVDDD